VADENLDRLEAELAACDAVARFLVSRLKKTPNIQRPKSIAEWGA
jgi:hypothetical protein